MISENTNSRYSKISISMHWLMFILIVAVYATINMKGLYLKGSDPREALKALHFMLGLTVLILVCIRLATRVLGTTPDIIPKPEVWQKISSKIMHILLYLLMITMPILGWLTLSAAGKSIPFFGVSLPALIAENKDLAKTIKEVHETIGTIGYYMIGLHAIAALFHHYIKRDNTLIRMLPTFRNKN